MIDQDGVGLANVPEALSVDGQFASLNPHIRLAARHEAVGRLSIQVGKTFRRRDSPTVAIGHADRMAAHLGLYFSQEQICSI